MKRRFLKTVPEADFHPLLPEYMEIFSWDIQVSFPSIFGGWMIYFNEGSNNAYSIDSLWVTDNEKEVERGEQYTKNFLKRGVGQLADKVNALGWLNTSYVLKPGLAELSENERFSKKLLPDKNLVNQLSMIFLEERIINKNSLGPENIFYTNLTGHGSFSIDDQVFSKSWENSIKEAGDISDQDVSLFRNQDSLNTLALEGYKKFKLKSISY